MASQHSFHKVGIDIMGSGIRGGNNHGESGIAGSGVAPKESGYGHGYGGGEQKKKFVNERQSTYEKISYKQNLSHPNTATSTILNTNTEKDPIQMVIGKAAQPLANNQQQQMSPVSSNQALEQYYSNAKSSQQHQIHTNPNPNEQLPSSNQQYQSNRSVAAKAGQMHIFNSQQISLTNKAKKFVSPPMSYYGKFQNPPLPHQQQDSVEFQPMKMKGGASIQSGQIQNPKYVDYINRIQQQEYSAKPPLASNYKSKEEHAYFDEQENESIQSTQQPDGVVSMFKQNQTLNNNQNRNGPQKSQMPNLNVSGEQMHIEEKSLTRKAMIAGGGFDNGQPKGTVASNSLSIKRIDLQVNAVAIGKQSKTNDENKGSFAGSGSNNIGHRIYDYVFVQMSQDKFDKEFSSKIALTKESSSAIQKAFTDKRYSNNNSTVAANSSKKPTQISVQHQGQMAVRYKGIRTSQEQQVIRNSNETFFSPQNQTSGSLLMDEITGSESKDSQLQGEKILKYSLMATQIDHIKIIGSNRFPSIVENLNDEEQSAFAEYMKDIISKISEKGRKFKITVKKKYIQDGLSTPPSQRISSVYVIVITSAPSLYFANTSSYEQNKTPLLLSQTIKTYSSSSSSSLSDYIKNYNYKENMANKNVKGLPYIQGKEGSQTRQGISNSIVKQMQVTKVRNNSTIQASNKTGYESENETTKSMNSTTTSSTVPFFPTRNFDNNNGTKIGTNAKNSARSLSQKGNSHPSISSSNPRKGQQKVEDSQFSSTQLITNKPDGVGNQAGKYPPTRIKIVQQNDYAHLESHRINKALVQYNQFIQLAFRTKGKINVLALNTLAKQMGIKLAQNSFSENGIKSREQGNLIKEKLIFYISKIINEENQPEGFINQDGNYFDDQFQGISHPQQLYKCFVGKGNNSILIRTLFKTRFWWLLHDKEEIEKVNFMWTQLRKNPIMDTFSCKFQDKKSNLRITSTTASNEINTPTMSSGKNMKKKKAQLLQSSTQSLENSSEKKDQQQFSKVAQQQIEQQQQQQQQQQLVAAQLNVKLYNKLEDNFHLSNKKALFINMRNYYEAMNKDVFSAVPVTFHVKEGLEDPEFIKFKAYYNKEEEDIKKQKSNKQNGVDNEVDKALVIGQPKKNIWILKPGENTNRGNGIMVAKDFEEIKRIIEESTATRKRTCIIQKYIHNPLLINKRKFDIRAYGFFTSINGNLKGYFYQEGYLRTSSKEFTLNNLGNRMIHLTNDAVQKKSDDYGKFEAGNKLSYIDFQNFFDKVHPDLNICFERDLLPQMKKLATDTFRAVYNKIDPKRRINTFEIYGYDFMFDDEFKVYLIEVNTNPCLELGCPLLARLIPNMVENALRLTVDPLFPPPENFSQKKCIVNDICPENKYELVFDERVDGPFLTELMKEKNNIIIEIDEEELSDCDEREDADN